MDNNPRSYPHFTFQPQQDLYHHTRSYTYSVGAEHHAEDAPVSGPRPMIARALTDSARDPTSWSHITQQPFPIERPTAPLRHSSSYTSASWDPGYLPPTREESGSGAVDTGSDCSPDRTPSSDIDADFNRKRTLSLQSTKTSEAAAPTRQLSKRRNIREGESNEQARKRQRRMREEGSCIRCTLQGDHVRFSQKAES